MANESIGASLINKLTDALENVSIGLGDVDTNTSETKEAIDKLNKDFITLFGGKSALSKLLLKDTSISKSTKGHLKSIDTKLGGIADLVDLNKKQLQELKKLSGGPGLSGATKGKGISAPVSGPASSLTKGQLEALLKKSNKGMLGWVSENPFKSLLYGGGAAALGIPQMLYKAVAGLSTAVPVLLAMHLGRDYAEGGLGQLGWPRGPGGIWEGREGTGVFGELGKLAPTAAGVVGGIGLAKYTRLGVTKLGRERIRGMGRGIKGAAKGAGQYVGGAFGQVMGKSGYYRRVGEGSAHVYQRLKGYNGTKITKAGILHFTNGKITGIEDADTGKLAKRVPGKKNKAFNKTLAKNATKMGGKIGLKTGARAIPLVGLFITLGMTISDAHDLMTDPDAYSSYKEEFDNAGLVGKAGLVLLNPTAALERGSEAILQGAFGFDADLQKHESKFMDPTSDVAQNRQMTVAGYTYDRYHKSRMRIIKTIQKHDDGLHYPYGFPGFAPTSHQIFGQKRYMSNGELLTQNLTNLRTIDDSLKEVSTIKAYKHDGKEMTWAEMKQAEESDKVKTERQDRIKSVTYTRSSDIDKIKGNRLKAMFEAGIINASDLPYMTDRNQFLLARAYGQGQAEFLREHVGAEGWARHHQEKETMLSTDYGAAQFQKRQGDTQRIFQEFLNANRKDLIQWLDRHEQIQNRATQSPVVVMNTVGDEYHIDQADNQNYGKPPTLSNIK